MERSHHYNSAYRSRILKKIETFPGQVFIREDLARLHTNREQLRLNRALKSFMDDGLITKISHGLYAKAMKMTFPDGDTKTVLRDSFESVTMEALDRLNVKWELGQSINEYNSGLTTQIPVVFTIRLLSRFRGSISAEGRTVIFEEKINAR